MRRYLPILGLLVACSDPPKCGIGDAPATVAATSAAPAITLIFISFSGSPNGDCPDPATPGVISLTIETPQGTPPFTLCVGRPDKLGAGLPFGTDPATPIELVDLDGTDASACTYTVDRNAPITGTAQSDGLCSNGTDAAGFALTLDATLSLNQKCGTTITSIAFALSGTVAVAGP